MLNTDIQPRSHRPFWRDARPARRNRTHYTFLILGTMLLGLASRKLGAYLPDFLRDYAGDTLWALLIFWLIGFLFTRKPSRWVAHRTLGFSFSIEVSQLYHAPWLDQLRETTLGSLVLGHGFLWSDLACYACGIGLGYVLEKLLNVNQPELVEINETVRQAFTV